MALSEGQQSALAQLQRIADTDRSPIRIVGVDDEPPPDACLSVDISLDCTHYPRVEGGLPLRDREGITLSIPADFPFSPPTVDTVHTRFHGFGHTPRALMEMRGPVPYRLRELESSASGSWFSRSRLD